MTGPIPLYLFYDVACAYCWITDQRIRQLQRELGDMVRVILRPYPLRSDQTLLGAADLKRLARHVRTAAKEPEAAGISAMMWKGDDPPRSSFPPLLAVEAALEQGPAAQARLLERLRTAAFRGGINIARRDVILEAAASAGLEMRTFTSALESSRVLRGIEESHREAMSRGVHAVPAVAVGDQWLMTGVRPLHEYRDAVLRWMDQHRGGSPGLTLH